MEKGAKTGQVREEEWGFVSFHAGTNGRLSSSEALIGQWLEIKGHDMGVSQFNLFKATSLL